MTSALSILRDCNQSWTRSNSRSPKTCRQGNQQSRTLHRHGETEACQSRQDRCYRRMVWPEAIMVSIGQLLFDQTCSADHTDPFQRSVSSKRNRPGRNPIGYLRDWLVRLLLMERWRSSQNGAFGRPVHVVSGSCPTKDRVAELAAVVTVIASAQPLRLSSYYFELFLLVLRFFRVCRPPSCDSVDFKLARL